MSPPILILSFVTTRAKKGKRNSPQRNWSFWRQTPDDLRWCPSVRLAQQDNRTNPVIWHASRNEKMDSLRYLRPLWKLLDTCTYMGPRSWVEKKNSLWKVIWYCAPVCRWTFLLKPSDLWRAAVVCAPMNSPKSQGPALFLLLDLYPSVVTGLHECQQWKWAHTSH